MKPFRIIILITLFLDVGISSSYSQSVFTLVKNQQKLADHSLSERSYQQAIEQYELLIKRNPKNINNNFQLAQCYYHIRQFEKCASRYERLLIEKKNAFSVQDMFFYAEVQTTLKNYNAALLAYQYCQQKEPDNLIFAKKIWRINNLQYMYEDSSHYLVYPLPINTTYSEMCPALLSNQIIFTGNRQLSNFRDQIDAISNAPFYKLLSVTLNDNLYATSAFTSKPHLFSSEIKARYNVGPAAFYNNGMAMVFVESSPHANANGRTTLGLQFAELKNGNWKRSKAFPFNSDQYSISDIAINEAGTMLFFSSEMDGGFGGKDIYVSLFEDGKWTKPVNAGENINTPYNEVFPYWHLSGWLYFSSDGHPGLGGLDIFKVPVGKMETEEPTNIGYPMNSSYDDFGLAMDSLERNGYLTSNRKSGGFDDDIYGFDVDLQVYPFTLTGIMKYKAHAWSDSSTITIWPNQKFQLVDSQKDVIVYERSTDADGRFSIDIPYFSRYFIQLVDEANIVHKVSIDIQKHKTETTEHEIVIVKDIFSNNNEE